MNRFILNISEKAFGLFKEKWESQKINKLISYIMVAVFVGAIIISYLDRANLISLGKWDESFANPFFAIEISFTLLLILELLSLIFVLPESVAKSVGKQFELLSLIFMRAGFKEFSHIDNFDWNTFPQEVINMFAYAFGALTIFFIMGVNYKLQMHSRLTNTEDDQVEFVQSKKLLAIGLLIAFLIIGVNDIKVLLTTGEYLHSFDKFYSVLIFSDIVIVFIALRYTLNYYRIFRYSAFVLATISIRISLSIQVYHNVLVGIIAAFFVLLLTSSYNYFLRTLPAKAIDE